MSSSISRRIQDSIEAFKIEDYEQSLIHVFPAIDKTSKKRRNVKKVGLRIKGFLQDELELITYISFQSKIQIECDGVSIIKAIYEYGRNSIVHEGELDSRLVFDKSLMLGVGPDWRINPILIKGLIMAVILAPENAKESLSRDYEFKIANNSFLVSELWGMRDKVKSFIDSHYPSQD